MTSKLEDMVAFLKARLDDDDHEASLWLERDPQHGRAANAEVASKRIIVQFCRVELLHTADEDPADHGPALAFAVLVLLVLAYDDHPDYRMEWLLTP